MKNKDKNSSQKLVSIIVPAFNVELYIEKCLLSILEQTYKDIEVIVVDDGSTDRTSEIIDIIAQQDERISIIHKENEGVSAARNKGIDSSNGDYLVFVDADDYLAPEYVEYMMKLVNNTGAEFCFSKCCYTKKGESQTERESIEILQPESATALLLSPTVIVGCWNKIFKKSLLIENNIRFSTTLFYGEGLSFITTVSQLASSIGVGNKKVYYYRRNNVDSATTKFNIEKIYNGEKALDVIEEQLIISSSKVSTMLNLHKCLFFLGAVVKLKANGMEKIYAKDYKRWKAYMRRNSIKFVFNRDVTLYRKMLLLGGCISPWIMMKLDIARRRNIAANSVDN